MKIDVYKPIKVMNHYEQSKSITWSPIHNPAGEVQDSWNPTWHKETMTFRHMSGEGRATSADKDLQSYCHCTSPLMQPITTFIATTPLRRNRTPLP